MIRLGLRLTLTGGREAATRLAVTAIAVAVGVGMLLVTVAGINAIKAQAGRGEWLTKPARRRPAPPARAGAGTIRWSGWRAPSGSTASSSTGSMSPQPDQGAAGLAELAYFAAAGHPATTSGQTRGVLPRIPPAHRRIDHRRPVAVHDRGPAPGRVRPAALIAGRRIADNPQAAYRAVSGLIPALFISSVATGIIVTLTIDKGTPAGRTPASDTLIGVFAGGPTASGRPAPSAAQVPWAMLARLRAVRTPTLVPCSPSASDRKRPFSLLRLTGVPLRLLRRVVTLESAIPLILAAAISAGTGLLAADLFLQAQFGVAIRSPGAVFYASLAAGLAISLGTIAAASPLLSRITGPESARNE